MAKNPLRRSIPKSQSEEPLKAKFQVERVTHPFYRQLADNVRSAFLRLRRNFFPNGWRHFPIPSGIAASGPRLRSWSYFRPPLTARRNFRPK